MVPSGAQFAKLLDLPSFHWGVDISNWVPAGLCKPGEQRQKVVQTWFIVIPTMHFHDITMILLLQ